MRDHSKPPANGRQPQPEPQFQFRGAWLPGPIIDALCRGELTGTDVSLLVIVESYVRMGGPGCFATNNHFAAVLNLHPMTVSRMVRKLRRTGHLISTDVDGVRYLETSWSRAAEGGVSAGRLPPYAPGAYRKEAKGIKEIHCPIPGPATPAAGPGGTGGKPMDDDVPTLVANVATPPTKRAIQPTPHHYQCADRLREYLTGRGVRNAWQRTAWAREMALCAREYGDRFAAVLEWYVTAPHPQMDMRYMPQAFSASGFRKKFPSIAIQMEEYYRRHPRSPITPEATRIIVRLKKDYVWPMGSGDQLPGAVARSYAAYYAWFKPISAAAAPDRRGKSPLWPFAHTIKTTLGPAAHYIPEWFRRVHGRISRWPSWSGDLEMFVWRPDHPEFVAVLKGMAYHNGPQFLDRFLKEVVDATQL